MIPSSTEECAEGCIPDFPGIGRPGLTLRAVARDVIEYDDLWHGVAARLAEGSSGVDCAYICFDAPADQYCTVRWHTHEAARMPCEMQPHDIAQLYLAMNASSVVTASRCSRLRSSFSSLAAMHCEMHKQERRTGTRESVTGHVLPLLVVTSRYASP